MTIEQLHEKINSAKIISIDMDGVIVGLFLGRVWFEAPYQHKSYIEARVKNRYSELVHNIFSAIDSVGALLSNYLKIEMPHSKEVLAKWKSQNKMLFVTTARRKGTARFTLDWLTAHGYMNSITKVEFNSLNVVPKYYKDEIVKKLDADIHIDDNEEIIRHLSQVFSNKTFILMDQLSKSTLKLSNVCVITSWAQLL